VRSNEDYRGGSRIGMRALHSRPERRGVEVDLMSLERGCVIPWRRPSWVRIPPPAPLSPVEITNSNLSVGEYNSPFRLQIELARSNEFKNLNQVVARRVHGEVVGAEKVWHCRMRLEASERGSGLQR